MRAPWTLLAVLAVLAMVRATDLEDKVSKTAEDFRTIMRTGDANRNVPVLEPASIPVVNLNIKASPFDSKVVASNIKVTGASGFKLTRIAQQGGSNKVAIALELPSIDVNSDYEINGKVKIGFIQVKVNGKGPLRVSLNNLKGDGVADLQVKNDGSLHVNDIKINNWSFGKLNIKLENLMGGGAMGNTVNKLLNKLAPSFIKSNHAKITGLAEKQGKKYINMYLDGKKASLLHEIAELETEDWTITDNVQEMLDQLALTLVAAPAQRAHTATDRELLEAAVSDELLDEQSDEIVARILELSESFRTVMKSGRQDVDIPASDPAVITELPFHVQSWPVEAHVSVKNVQVSGASAFQINKVSPVPGTNKFSLDLFIPSLTVVSDYDLQASFKMAFISLNANRRGDLRFALEGLRCTATAEIVIDPKDDGLTLNSVQIDSWSFDNVGLEVENFAHDGYVKKTINFLMNKLFPLVLIKPHVDDLSGWAATASQRVVARFLNAVANRIALPNLDTRVNKMLEEFKTVMKKGNAEYSIPVLDPAIVDEIAGVSIDSALLKAKVDAKNVIWQGTSAYTITKISQRAGTNELDVEIAAGDLVGNGDMDVSGTAFSTFSYTDHGSVNVVIKGLRATARASMTSNIDGTLALKSLHITSWSYDDVKAEFANLQTGGKIGKLLNQVINTVLPGLVKLEKNRVTVWAERAFKTVLDQYLFYVAGQGVGVSPRTVHVTDISSEAMDILKELALLAVGLEQPANAA